MRRNRIKHIWIVRIIFTIACMGIIIYAFTYEKHNTKESLKNVKVMDFFSPSDTEKKESYFIDGRITSVIILAVNGNKVSLEYQNEIKDYSISNANELSDFIGRLCDIEIKNSRLVQVDVKGNIKEDKIITIDDNSIETENNGKLELSKPFTLIYRNASNDENTFTYTYSDNHQIKNGKKMATLYFDNQRVCAMIIESKDLSNISVLLKNSNGENYCEKVTISGTNGINIENGNKTKTLKTLSLSTENKFSQISITPVENGTIAVEKDGKVVDNYRGKIIIKKNENGLVVINRLKLEEYLVGVVSSEMPKSASQEALCAQTVCARTYAVGRIANPKYEDLGADIDDTSACQAYNPGNANEQAQKAVEETNGSVLVFNEKIANTFYFSTSCGFTTSVENTFSNSVNDVSYMKTLQQTSKNALTKNEDNRDRIDLSNEKAFRNFISNRKSTTEYIEEDCDWYRWNTEIDVDYLNKLHSSPKDEQYVGKIQKISVKSRDESGIVLELKVTGDKDTKIIKGQSLIRKYLNTSKSIITLCGNETKTKEKSNIKMLPSAFFYLDIKDSKIIIHGGGYGHGTGLSQYGAIKLASAGFNYKDILEYYFPGTTLLNSYEQLVQP